MAKQEIDLSLIKHELDKCLTLEGRIDAVKESATEAYRLCAAVPVLINQGHSEAAGDLFKHIEFEINEILEQITLAHGLVLAKEGAK